ncbi:monocarboxylate transporter [Aureococcus anophagefferens]|nr:monocarboxylate transporter [Aureococcus anophagefferens]
MGNYLSRRSAEERLEARVAYLEAENASLRRAASRGDLRAPHHRPRLPSWDWEFRIPSDVLILRLSRVPFDDLGSVRAAAAAGTASRARRSLERRRTGQDKGDSTSLQRRRPRDLTPRRNNNGLHSPAVLVALDDRLALITFQLPARDYRSLGLHTWTRRARGPADATAFTSALDDAMPRRETPTMEHWSSDLGRGRLFSASACYLG